MKIKAQHGSSSTPILVFCGIVGLSVVFFFLFTLPRWTKPKEKKGPVAATVDPAVPKIGEPVTPLEPEVLTQPTTAPVQTAAVFGRSQDLMAALAQKLTEGDATFATKFFAGVAPAKEQFFTQLFEATGMRPAGTSAWREVGRISGAERWLLTLEDPSAPAIPPPAPPVPENSGPTPTPAVSPRKTPPSPHLVFDFKTTAQEGCRIIDLRIPQTLVDAVGHLFQAKGFASPGLDLVDPPDPLSSSHDFLTNLLSQEFQIARSLTDEKTVPQEKLAGLCIVMEEGGYRMAPQHSLNVTAANSQKAWAIVRVQSEQENVKAEFGLELGADPQRGWKIEAVDFGKLLDYHVKATNQDSRVFYTPIVKSPTGGESLVVYFDYDKSELTPRGERQMEIVAGLLKSDPARKLRLTGHADAQGPEDYNYQLSRRRAEAVRTKLASLGVAANQIVSQGFGETAPLDPNEKNDGSDNPEGRSRNRRTEIFLDF